MKEAYYFSHDSNARHDPKITAMRGAYGAEGYGWYWMLIEMMRESSDYKLDMQGKYTFNAFALQLQGDSKKIEEFVHDCIHEFNLFCSDGTHFWSESLMRRMQIREQKSEARRKAAQARWNKEKRESGQPSENAEEMQMHSNSSANGMQGKESKGKESKEKLNKKDNNVPFQEIINYLNQKAGTKYRANSKATQKHIQARWNEKFTLDDFKTVIDKKVEEWSGSSMEQYLRPETLFGSKFESYLNQKGVTRNAQQQRPTPFKPDNANHTPGKTEASVQSTANSGYAAGDTEPDWSIFVRG
ncbi:conserved phage C-terminal domain-containing protein [Paenibacillus larvae]|uniref:Lin1244/Lin1753-like N-terminal domain-containing protein n=1 Tax=Paenibacillus larvae subsp. pulvifaciens TaxID=1477 RepID=A0A1V0UP06_9BACL|nr:conserved phage C-terminal domain-containing protein [Paenibacillus larvae]ARF66698.1 hypothetical protein B7C51_01065 [Paenibacillus larvae subsp. pulvifaciens]ARF69670.1 hypothetical protein B7C51_20300 [Paenibacillus larvae subsp. pulvifaciens]